MTREKRYVVAKHLSLDSSEAVSDGKAVVNTATGQRLHLSAEAVRVLEGFKLGRTLSESSRYFRLKRASERARLRGIIRSLAKAGFLVDASQREEDTYAALRREIRKDPFVTARASFADCPKARVCDLEPGGVVFAGVPIDFATSGRPGARSGPERLRDVSLHFLRHEQDPFSNRSRGWYNGDLDAKVLEGVGLYDVGDVFIEPSDRPDEVFERCYKGARTILERGCLPVFLGGDHSIAAPLIKASCDTFGEIAVVHCDAHTDRGEWQPTVAHHHGNVMTRVLRENRRVRLYQYGLRGFCGEPAARARCQTVLQRELEYGMEKMLQRSIPQGKRCYITLDVDVLDPVFAPGTGTPVPMGMHPRALLMLLEAVIAKNEIVGIDIVEVCPEYDRGDITAATAVHLLMCMLGAVYRRRRRTLDGRGRRLSRTTTLGKSLATHEMRPSRGDHR